MTFLKREKETFSSIQKTCNENMKIQNELNAPHLFFYFFLIQCKMLTQLLLPIFTMLSNPNEFDNEKHVFLTLFLFFIPYSLIILFPTVIRCNFTAIDHCTYMLHIIVWCCKSCEL